MGQYLVLLVLFSFHAFAQHEEAQEEQLIKESQLSKQTLSELDRAEDLLCQNSQIHPDSVGVRLAQELLKENEKEFPNFLSKIQAEIEERKTGLKASIKKKQEGLGTASKDIEKNDLAIRAWKMGGHFAWLGTTMTFDKEKPSPELEQFLKEYGLLGEKTKAEQHPIYLKNKFDRVVISYALNPEKISKANISLNEAKKYHAFLLAAIAHGQRELFFLESMSQELSLNPSPKDGFMKFFGFEIYADKKDKKLYLVEKDKNNKAISMLELCKSIAPQPAKATFFIKMTKKQCEEFKSRKGDFYEKFMQAADQELRNNPINLEKEKIKELHKAGHENKIKLLNNLNADKTTSDQDRESIAYEINLEIENYKKESAQLESQKDFSLESTINYLGLAPKQEVSFAIKRGARGYGVYPVLREFEYNKALEAIQYIAPPHFLTSSPLYEIDAGIIDDAFFQSNLEKQSKLNQGKQDEYLYLDFSLSRLLERLTKDCSQFPN